MLSNKSKMVYTILIAVIGGFLFSLINIPLPWLLGPLFFVMVANIRFHYQLNLPSGYKNVGLFFLSYVLGTSFTMDTVLQVADHLPLMLTITMITVLFSILMAVVISFIGKLNVKDAILGSVPGGLSNMVALSEEIEGTNITTVTTIQLVRLLSVITIVPILAAIIANDSATNLIVMLNNAANEPKVNELIDSLIYIMIIPLVTWLSFKIKLPTAIIIGPIVSTAVLVILGFQSPSLPTLFLNIAQLLVGSHIGLLMVLKGARDLKHVLMMALLLSFCTIGFSVLIGYIMPNLMDVTILTGLLGAAPGGVAEMGVTAAQLHANVSVVTAYQLFRLFFILLIMPFVLRILLKKLHVRHTT
jgi:membrane AbrB-like protein